MNSTTDCATYQFPTSDAAWAFMHACDAAKLATGFPSVDGLHTVQVSIPTWMAREEADKLAVGAPVVDYHRDAINAHRRICNPRVRALR